MNIQEYSIEDYTGLSELPIEYNGKKSLWGIAPTAPLHLGYDALFLLQKEIVKLGAQHTIIFADMHSMLSHGQSWEESYQKTNYYGYILKNVYEIDARYITGSSLQRSDEYIFLIYGLLRTISISNMKGTIPSARKNEQVFLYQLLYALMQCLDAIILGAEIIVAEGAQKKIYDLLKKICKTAEVPTIIGKNYIDQIKNVRIIYIKTSHDIKGNRLNKSSRATRISFHDTPEVYTKKVKKMFAPPQKTIEKGKHNAMLEHYKYSVFPWFKKIELENEAGDIVNYDNYERFQEDYLSGNIHPANAKEILLSQIGKRLNKIQTVLQQGLTSWINPAFYT